MLSRIINMEPRYMRNSAGLFEKAKYFLHCTPFIFYGITRRILFADHFWTSFGILVNLRNWCTRSICELGRHNRRLLTCQLSTSRYLLGRHWAYSNMLNVNINSNLHSEFFCERHHRRCRDVVLFGLGLTCSCSEIIRPLVNDNPVQSKFGGSGGGGDVVFPICTQMHDTDARVAFLDWLRSHGAYVHLSLYFRHSTCL